MKLYNHYVSVIVEGQLDNWTGANPEKDPGSIMTALQRAECYKSLGKTAYAVEIKELKESDYYDKIEKPKSEVLSALKELNDWMLNHTGPNDGTMEMLIRAKNAITKTKG